MWWVVGGHGQYYSCVLPTHYMFCNLAHHWVGVCGCVGVIIKLTSQTSSIISCRLCECHTNNANCYLCVKSVPTTHTTEQCVRGLEIICSEEIIRSLPFDIQDER